MERYKLEMYIRNLEGLVKSLKDQNPAKSDFKQGMNAGMEIAADSIQMEIDFIKAEMGREENECAS